MGKKKELSIKYDKIIVYETNLQKLIVDKLIETDVEPEKALDSTLLIDARNNQIRIEDDVYHINVGGLRWTIKSACDLSKFPKLRTKELIGTHFTGLNCRIFEALIDYDTLSIIDDGIGTPALLRNERFVRTYDWLLRFVCAYILILLTRFRRIKSVKYLLNNASRYYTIYSFIDKDYARCLNDVDVIHLSFFESMHITKIQKGIAGYIGSGANKFRKECLEYVTQRHQRLIYFPHPREVVDDFVSHFAEEIIRPTQTIESYFSEHGIPEYLYGDMSSVFLNLKLSGVNTSLVVFSFVGLDDTYCKIYKENGIDVLYIADIIKS